MTDEVKAGSTGAGWRPRFPADDAPPRDSSGTAMVVGPIGCDGHDRHPLSLPPRHTLGYGVAGAGLIAIAAWMHLHGRLIGVGIGLLLVPLAAFLFERWVNGPV